jgi:DNA-binding transcriptional LysR family regulator
MENVCCIASIKKTLVRMAVVASPTYFSKHLPPQEPHDLANHVCIKLRLPIKGGLYAWEFQKNGHEAKAHVQGQLVFNSSAPILRAALAGFRGGLHTRRYGAGAYSRGSTKSFARGLVPTQ